MRKSLSYMLLLFFAVTAVSFGQSISFQRVITVSSNGFTNTVTVGVNGDGAGPVLDNTFGGDDASGGFTGIWEEGQLPPTPPPPFDFDVRLITLPNRVGTWPTGLGTGMAGSFHGYRALTQIDTFRVQMQGSQIENNGATISWTNDLNTVATSWEIKGFAGTSLVSTDMLSTTSVTIPAQFSQLQVLVIVTSYLTAASPGPTFQASANPLNFNNVTPNATVTQNLTITNPGTTNDLVITNLNITGSQFSLVGAPATPITILAGGGTQVFTVQYIAPASQASADLGSIEFTHNDPTPSTLTTVNLSGSIAAAPVNTLLFSAAQVDRSDNKTGLRDSLFIKNFDAGTAGGDITALQLFIISNMQGLRLSGVSRGSLIANSANWGFATEIANGPINADLSSNDTIKVVIFALNGSTSISTGLYFSDDLVKFTYETVDIDADSVDANLHLAAVVASNSDGAVVTLTPDNDQLVRIFNQGGVVLGDANGDGSLNVLDILEVIDHILGRDYLVGANFDRANIAPWGTPDAFVNAQDLGLIQSIILAGQYPDGTLLSLTGDNNGGLSKQGIGNVDLTFEVSAGNVVVRMNSNVAVKGIQFDMNGIDAVNGAVKTSFGSVFAELCEDGLRTLVYDVNGTVLPAGQHVIAELPVEAAGLLASSINNLTVAGDDNNAIARVTVRVQKNGLAGSAPASFALEAAYPNPFNPSTTISFSVPFSTNVTLAIYNPLGELVRTLVNGEMQNGVHSITWDGRDDAGRMVNSGLYMYRMTAGNFSSVRSMLLTK